MKMNGYVDTAIDSQTRKCTTQTYTQVERQNEIIGDEL